MAKMQVRKNAVTALQEVPLPLSHAAAFWGIAGLLFFSPYFRGLFFPPEQERALIVAALVFWLVYFGRWIRHRTRFFEHPLDFWVLGLPVVYLISSFAAVNKGLAVNEIVKNSLYFMVFWAVSRLVTGEEFVRRTLSIIWASGVLVALAGLATATGIIFIRDGFLGGRIYSTFQYPNALANYLLCVLVLGAYLWLDALGRGSLTLKNLWPSRPAWFDRLNPVAYLFAGGNFLLATVFWGAKSNGGILTLLVIAPLLLFGLPKSKRRPLFLHALQVGVPGLFVALVFIKSAMAQKYDLAWLWVFTGLLTVVGLQVLYDLVLREKLGGRVKIPFWVPAGVGGVLATGVAVALAVRPGLWQKLLAVIHFRNAVERLYFYRDALEMIAARPLLGWGGGGWQEAYRAFQHYLYNSTQVHGYYFQVGVETGVAGLLVVAGIWFFFLRTAHRLYHGSPEDDPRCLLVWVLTVAALSVGIHSAVDFNLSLSALALVLFAIFGMVLGLALPKEGKKMEKKEKKRRKVSRPLPAGPLAAVAAAAVVLVAGGLCLAVANNRALAADLALRSGDIRRAAECLEVARMLNPFEAEYDAVLGRIRLAQGDTGAGIKATEAAVAKSRYSAVRYAELASAYQAAGKHDAAVNCARKAVSLAPFQIYWYENLSRVAFASGYMELNAKDTGQARRFFEQAVAVPKAIRDRMATVTPRERRLWAVAPLMEPTPAVETSAGGAYYFLGRFAEAEKMLDGALKEIEGEGVSDQEKQMYAEACLWRALLAKKQGNTALSQQYIEKGKAAVPEIEGWHEFAAKLPVLK